MHRPVAVASVAALVVLAAIDPVVKLASPWDLLRCCPVAVPLVAAVDAHCELLEDPGLEVADVCSTLQSGPIEDPAGP